MPRASFQLTRVSRDQPECSDELHPTLPEGCPRALVPPTPELFVGGEKVLSEGQISVEMLASLGLQGGDASQFSQ